MKILITGSSGLIGTNLALRLLDEGFEVLGVDRRPNTWTDRIDTVERDLLEPLAADTFGSPPSLVVHLAAHAKVYELVVNPRRAMENIEDLFNVLEYCREIGAPIIFGSSREVYGDIHRQITDETQADFVVAESPYSASKIAGEALIYSYSRCYKLPYLVFRFSNVYGRFDSDRHRMERVIPLFIQKIANDEPLTVYGKEKMLDFTFYEDCIDGIARGIRQLLEGSVQCRTINLAYGEGNSLGSMCEYIGEELNKKPRIDFQPARPGEVTHYVADITQARQLLGYNPKTPLREGIRKAIAWQREFYGAKFGRGE